MAIYHVFVNRINDYSIPISALTSQRYSDYGSTMMMMMMMMMELGQRISAYFINNSLFLWQLINYNWCIYSAHLSNISFIF